MISTYAMKFIFIQFRCVIERFPKIGGIYELKWIIHGADGYNGVHKFEGTQQFFIAKAFLYKWNLDDILIFTDNDHFITFLQLHDSIHSNLSASILRHKNEKVTRWIIKKIYLQK